MAPSTATLATALPETVPKRLDETTETLAVPPRYRPMATKATSVMNLSPPTAYRAWPKKMNATTMLAATVSGTPRRPLESR